MTDTSAAPGGVTAGYRWTICALLFFATTINYIDRQILSLLKPILDEQLEWTNEEFGMVNSAFQGAYGLGLLVFGWFIDRYGTKIGYAVSIAAWSVAAIGHAFVGQRWRVLRRADRARSRRRRQLPVGDQGGGALVPEEGTRACHEHLQLRHECRGDHRARSRPLDRVHLGLAGRVHRGRHRRVRLAALLDPALRRPEKTKGSPRRTRAHPQRPRRARTAEKIPWLQPARVTARPGRSSWRSS